MKLTPALRAALLSLLMILCAGATNAVMDVLVSRYEVSVFSRLPESEQAWFNPKISYRYRWKNGDRAQGEAFLLSSTALSPLTDAWHFCKALTILFLYLAILAPLSLLIRWPWYVWLLVYLGVEVLRGGLFEFLYQFMLIC